MARNGYETLGLDDRREHHAEETGTFSVAFKSKTVRLSTIIALLTAVAGLFYTRAQGKEPPQQPAAFYAPAITAKDTEQDFRLHLLEEGVKDMRSDVKYLREREERRQGREEAAAGRRR